MLTLDWARGLQHYQLIALLGWPLLLGDRGNSTSSKLWDLEVLSLQESLRSSTHKGLGDVVAKSYTLQAIPYRRTYKNQNFFFWFTSDAVLQETHLSIPRLIREFLRGGLQAKVVLETDYLLRFFWSHARNLKRIAKQTPFWLIIRSKSLRNPHKQVDHKKRDTE